MNTNTLSILARREPIDHETWAKLAADRLSQLRPVLRDMTLQRVRDVPMILSRGKVLTLGQSTFIPSSGEFNLDTRGIFTNSEQVMAYKLIDSNIPGALPVGTIYKTWGLTRDGKWVAICVTTAFGPQPQNRSQDITDLTITETTFLELCTFAQRSPWAIWKRLGEAVKQWADHREKLYYTARDLNAKFCFEETLLEHVPKE